MNKYVKAIIGILIIAIPAVLLLGFLFNKLTTKSFYSNSGTVRVKGIKSDVKIYSGDYGVPHIIASSDEDMYFALGYMHAQDRLWQMDLSRRVAEGKLSEIFGSSTIKYDKLFRTIGINRFVYRWYKHISPKSKQILASYTDGVNEFIAKHFDELPVEFDLLNYKPVPWQPENSLMITRMMGWDLNLAWYSDYIMGEIVSKVGLEKASEIFPDSSIAIFRKPIILDSAQIDSLKKLDSLNEISSSNIRETLALGKDFFRTYESYREFFNINCTHMGSNSWVVSSSKSETGKPILANDPHLAFMAPSKWYEVHLKSKDIDVTGMSIAGVPGVAIGHNNIIAWGLTNLMNDDNDFFLLEKDSADANKYRFENQVHSLDSIKEKINVKDSNEIYFTVKNTLLGPVISNLDTRGFISENEHNLYENELLTFKWTGFENSDEVDAFYKINKAKNWEEFKSALKEFCVPAQNFIYADTSGNIGYKAAGKIPIRKTENKNNYIYPSYSDMEWTGFINFNELPEIYNPKQGYIATANTNPNDWLKTENKINYYISYIWEPSSRFNRINSVLKDGFKFNVGELKSLQASYQSPYAKEISEFITEAFKNYTDIDNETSQVLNMLKNWNGDMPANDPMGAIYNVFFINLLKNIYFDELGEDVFHDFIMIPNIPFRSTLLLLRNYKQDNPQWFDNVNTGRVETRNEIIRKSLFEAIDFLKKKFSSNDANLWHWGELHKVTFKHPLGVVPELAKSFNIGPFEVGGDQTTVNNSEYSFNDAIRMGAFDNSLGPSMRMIVDLADISHSFTVNTTGESGQPLHPDYADQTRLWLNNDYKTIITNELEMLKNDYSLLILKPEN
jgi:penicillin amidase